MIFEGLNVIARGLMALNGCYNIYDKITKNEYNSPQDVAEIALHALTAGAVGSETVALNQVNQMLFGLRANTYANTARIAATATTVIQVSNNKEMPIASKAAKVASRILLNISPVVDFEQESCQTIGMLIAGVDEWYFRSHKKRSSTDESAELSTQSEISNEEEITIDVLMGFDEWARGQITCQDKVCKISQLYLFNVMVWKGNRNFKVEQRHLQTCQEQGAKSFRFEGKTYKIDEFEREPEESRENCRFYLNVLVPGVKKMTEKSVPKPKKTRQPAKASKEVRKEIKKSDSKKVSINHNIKSKTTKSKLQKDIVKNVFQSAVMKGFRKKNAA